MKRIRLDELDEEILRRMLTPVKLLGFTREQVMEVIGELWDKLGGNDGNKNK